jgi:N,N'-diacetyllegionaminate synthase
MRIGSFTTDTRVLVVAEIGNNHEGDFFRAKEMVHAAADSGADAVKFQTFRTELYVAACDRQRVERLRRFELTPDQFAELAQIAHARGRLFLSTPFDLESAAALRDIVDAYKVASGDNDFYPLLRQVAGTAKPLILSCGLCDLAQTHRAVECVRQEWNKLGTNGQMALLHCVSAYPVPPAEANLLVIQTLQREFGFTTGYSDHTLGVEACVLAAALGARILEKHFTLDKRQSDFRDHQLSADPAEMRQLIERVRMVPVLMGSPEKKPPACELATAPALRRSAAAAHDLQRGRRITPDDLIWIRPAGEVPPGREELLAGKCLRRDMHAGEQFQLSDVEETAACE